MVSAIDATKPIDGILASKGDLRANLLAAKTEIEALQAVSVPVRATLHVSGGADGTYYAYLDAPALTIASLTAVTTGTRSCTAAVRIEGIDVTSLDAVSVTTSKATTNATGANTVNAGDEVTVVLSAGAGSGDVILSVNGSA